MNVQKPKKAGIPSRLLVAGVILLSLLLVILVWWYYQQRIEALNQIIEK